jgi:hypothetical protein
MIKLTLDQRLFVADCLASYRHEPPIGYHWENAHFPKSRELGGTTTVRLWWPHHIVQNCLQTLEYKYPCVYVGNSKKEREALAATLPEYLPVYEAAYTFCKQYAGLQAVRKKTGIHNPEMQQVVAEGRRKGGSAAGAASKAEGKGIFDPALQTPLARSITARKGGISLLKQGKGIFGKVSPKQRKKNCQKGAAVVNSQRWVSLSDGFESTASGVAAHNRALGVPAEFRMKVGA